MTKHQVRLATNDRGVSLARHDGDTHMLRNYTPCDQTGQPSVTYQWDGTNWRAEYVHGHA